jgi:hypothetical protein
MPEATDAYINVAIRSVDAPYGSVFEPALVRTEFPQGAWPARRCYTVRAWDAARRLLTVRVGAASGLSWIIRVSALRLVLGARRGSLVPLG